jgi:hypothetical protein
VTDEEVARLRAHGNNISRYRRLLKTNLSDLERRFLERRLSGERSAVASLAHPALSPRTGTAGQFDAGARRTLLATRITSRCLRPR